MKEAEASRGLPSGVVDGQWGDSNPQPLHPKATTSSASPPPADSVQLGCGVDSEPCGARSWVRELLSRIRNLWMMAWRTKIPHTLQSIIDRFKLYKTIVGLAVNRKTLSITSDSPAQKLVPNGYQINNLLSPKYLKWMWLSTEYATDGATK